MLLFRLTILDLQFTIEKFNLINRKPSIVNRQSVSHSLVILVYMYYSAFQKSIRKEGKRPKKQRAKKSLRQHENRY
jgi:hypothetical protein